MEWRNIVPVLCLIGILHVPGNAAQMNNTYRFTLHFSINDTFLDVYLSSNNTATVDLRKNITTQVETLYKAKYTNFERFEIWQIRNGSIVTEGELQFINGSKPNVTDLTQTLNNGSFTFAIIKNATSIAEVPTNNSTTATPATTLNTNQTATPVTNQTATPNTNQTVTPVTTVSAPAKVAQINLGFRIDQEFKDIYSNLSNPQTIELSNNITTACSRVYKSLFPNFFRMFIRKFSKGSVVIDSVIEFDSTNGTSPNMTDVKETLVKAVTNGNFSVPINSSSITANIPETSAVSAASNLTDYNITFKLNDDFTQDLSNITSDAATKLAKNITSELDGFYKGFKNFKRSLVWRFRSGSIVVDGLLGFNNTLANNPTVSELAWGLAEAVRNGTVKLSVDPKSITVTDSSGVAANRSPVLASMLTALWMTLVSLLLSAVMH